MCRQKSLPLIIVGEGEEGKTAERTSEAVTTLQQEVIVRVRVRRKAKYREREKGGKRNWGVERDGKQSPEEKITRLPGLLAHITQKNEGKRAHRLEGKERRRERNQNQDLEQRTARGGNTRSLFSRSFHVTDTHELTTSPFYPFLDLVKKGEKMPDLRSGMSCSRLPSTHSP